MRREPREVWVKRVERWRDSGLTAKEFAAELGVNPHTLQHWKYRLGVEGRGKLWPAQKKRRRRTSRQPAQSVTFVELPGVQPAQPRFEVELRGGRRIHVPPLFDEKALSRLVRALEAEG